RDLPDSRPGAGCDAVKWLLVLLLAACNHGNDVMGGADQDLATVPDLAGAADLASPPGPSCGQIAMCVFTCRMDLTCYQGCVAGASPATLATLGQLVLCAGTNCLNGLGGGDGGMGPGNLDQQKLFMCLFMKCQQQLAMCGGLFGGM